jgi:hypothetical protein
MSRAPAATAAVVLLLAFAGCSAPAQREQPVEFSHVHGLGYDAATGDLLVATHHGLVRGHRQDDGWTWAYAGSERYDYMGFAQDAVDPAVLYSSGHPDDPRAYGGVHLGLRRSTDGGVTWEQRSLKGEVDFHALSAVPGVAGGLVGIWRDRLMESRDGGLTWVNHTGPAALMFDVAVTAHHVYVATADGLAGGHLGNRSSWERHADPEPGRPAMALAASADGSLMFAGTGNGRSGATSVSRDNATTWQTLTEPLLATAAVPATFAFDPSDGAHVFAATSAGDVLESRDTGATWAVLRRA